MSASEPLCCDFCGKRVERVRRIALERGYDRLGQRHAVRYACPECSQRKERDRAPETAPAGAAPGRR